MKRILLHTTLSALVAMIIVAELACRRKDTPQPLSVFVTMPAQADFVERIGREHVSVHVLVRPGQEPHTFQPTPKQMTALSRARLFFKIGMPFEDRLVQKIRGAHRRLTVVDTAEGIQKRVMAAGHDHHEAAGPDLHIWLSPPLIRIQAQNIAEALQKADPANADDYEKNLAAFLTALNATHAKIQTVLEPHRGQSFYVFHPSFGYFADAYGLKQVAVETEGKAPTPKQLSALIKRAKAEHVKIIFVQPQFDKRSAEAVAGAIGGAVVPMDPLARDVLKNLEEMAAKIEKALSE